MTAAEAMNGYVGDVMAKQRFAGYYDAFKSILKNSLSSLLFYSTSPLHQKHFGALADNRRFAKLVLTARIPMYEPTAGLMARSTDDAEMKSKKTKKPVRLAAPGPAKGGPKASGGMGGIIRAMETVGAFLIAPPSSGASRPCYGGQDPRKKIDPQYGFGDSDA